MNARIFIAASLLLAASVICAAEPPRGFFVEDLSQGKPIPAFYNLDLKKVVPFPFRYSYDRFIEIIWDRTHGRVFFSARRTSSEPYRVYVKPWPAGEETPVYENPLGPFRFLLSPNSDQLALQVMGPSAWPILAVHDWKKNQTISLGIGFSPDWSSDGQSLLYLKIPGSLPSYLEEYRIETSTSTRLIATPVAEAIYAGASDKIILKTASQSKGCDEFQLWNRRADSLIPFSTAEAKTSKRHCSSQREINAFPGHEFVYFKESETSTDFSEQTLVVCDAEGSRLQVVPTEKWTPKVTAVEAGTLVIGEDPLYVMSADGAGGAAPVPQARFIKFQR